MRWMSDSVRPLPPPSLPPMRGSVSPDDARDNAELDAVLRAPSGFAPEKAIDEQIEDLERWAVVNLRQDRNDKIRYWLLRSVAFLGAAGAAVAAGLVAHKAALVLAALAALAVAVESAWPSAVKSPGLRAVHDLRELQNSLKLRWDKVRLAHPDPHAPQRVAHAMAMLDQVQSKREEIGKYLVSADPTQGITRR